MTPPRKFLAPGARAGDGHGHLTKPLRPIPTVADEPHIIDRIATHTNLCDEPEEISRAIVEPYTELARTYDAIRYAAELEQLQVIRQALALEQRLAEARRRAKRQHINVSRELNIIDQLLTRAQRGGRTTPPEAIRRIERVEERLDHRPDLAA